MKLSKEQLVFLKKKKEMSLLYLSEMDDVYQECIKYLKIEDGGIGHDWINDYLMDSEMTAKELSQGLKGIKNET